MINIIKKFHIHPLFWVIIGIGIVTGNFREIFMLFFIVIIHEMGHASAAHFFSWRIKRIELLPFGGVAEMDEHGNRPLKEELLVILAGPVQHIWLIGAGYLLQSFSVISEAAFSLFLFHNVVIALFNLLPIWPLDGGKLLFLLLSINYSFIVAHKWMISLSLINLLIFSIGFILYTPYHLNLWFVAFFLLFSIIMERRQRHYVFMRFLLERYYGKQVSFTKLQPLIVQDYEKLQHILMKFQRGCKHPIIVEKDNRQNSPIDENELLHAYFVEKQISAQIGEILYTY